MKTLALASLVVLMSAGCVTVDVEVRGLPGRFPGYSVNNLSSCTFDVLKFDGIPVEYDVGPGAHAYNPPFRMRERGFMVTAECPGQLGVSTGIRVGRLTSGSARQTKITNNQFPRSY